MKKLMEIALGIVTSVGGFLEIGSITTAAQAGAEFSFQLIWAIVLGGICIIFLVEQSGRFTAVSGRTIPDAIRERFGVNYFLFLYIILGIVSLLVLGAEIGGVCIALELATGIGFQYWVLPAAFVIWLVIWKGTFGVIEKGVSVLGLVTLCFVVGAFVVHPPWHQVLHGALASLPQHDQARYWFIAVSILGASISPYLFFFYSSGAIEDEWDESYVGVNRVIATGGMSFGTLISIAVLILAAFILLPRGIKVEHYSQLPLLLVPVFGRWGFWLLVASLGIACLGAAMEITLEIAYLTAQGFGWNWSENQHPSAEARFSLTYTITILLAAIFVLAGIDPLKLTIFSMALTAATLPVSIVPFLFLMNDQLYVRGYRNSWFSNSVVLLIIGLAFLLAVVTIPLQILEVANMDLVRDCLDEQLLDRQNRPMGRIDGIVLTLEPGRQPRVSHIELGTITIADRIGARIGRLVRRLMKRTSASRYRIPMSKIRVGLNTVTADVEAEKTTALEWELWLRKKVIGRIPGA